MPAGVAVGVASASETKAADGASSYAVVVGTREPAACALLPTPARLMARYNKTCAVHRAGYWSYSACIGQRILQVRLLQGGGD